MPCEISRACTRSEADFQSRADDGSGESHERLKKQAKKLVSRLIPGESCVIFPRDFNSARPGGKSGRGLHLPIDQHGSPQDRRLLMAKKNAAPTKSEILTQIAKDTELSKKQVSDMFESLSGIVKKSLKGSGLFTLPGLLKMKVVKKPATKAREGINPFNGEKMMFKAKPASKKVRIAALKNLKEMVN
jgi:DNA-binding protein HU-beta